MTSQRSEHTVAGVHFEPVLQLSEQLHPHVFSFLAIIDVPVYHRLDSHSLSLDSYYIDEQILLRMLKPSTKQRRSIHALDSVRYIRDCLGMDTDHTAAEVTHWSQVPRDVLFHDVHPDDVAAWTNNWRLTGRKITILSLTVFRYYVMDLELALRQSVQKLVVQVIKTTLQRTTGNETTTTTMTSTKTSNASMRTRLLTLAAYPSFDMWWSKQCKSSLFLNLDASTLGVALSWLFVFNAEAGVDRVQGVVAVQGRIRKGGRGRSHPGSMARAA